MKTGGSSGDILMLVVPIAVSFALIVFMSGGVDGFVIIVDTALRETAVSIGSWVRSL